MLILLYQNLPYNQLLKLNYADLALDFL